MVFQSIKDVPIYAYKNAYTNLKYSSNILLVGRFFRQVSPVKKQNKSLIKKISLAFFAKFSSYSSESEPKLLGIICNQQKQACLPKEIHSAVSYFLFVVYIFVFLYFAISAKYHGCLLLSNAKVKGRRRNSIQNSIEGENIGLFYYTSSQKIIKMLY